MPVKLDQIPCQINEPLMRNVSDMYSITADVNSVGICHIDNIISNYSNYSVFFPMEMDGLIQVLGYLFSSDSFMACQC